jgi:hypothetical protein
LSTAYHALKRKQGAAGVDGLKTKDLPHYLTFNWERIKEKIKIIRRKTSPIPLGQRIERLNQLMRGWVNYFKHATGYQKLKDLDAWIRCR